MVTVFGYLILISLDFYNFTSLSPYAPINVKPLGRGGGGGKGQV